MKKTILLCCMLLLTGVQSFAALVVNFSFYPYSGNSSITVDAGNNASYPSYYQATVSVGIFSNTGCAGTFTAHVLRKLPSETQFHEVFDVFTPHFESDGVYSYYSLNLLQPEGTTYQYKLKADFQPDPSCPNSIGNETKTTGITTVTVRPYAHPCFTLGKGIFGGIPIPADNSPVMLCDSNNLYIDGSCSTNETKYYVGVEESNAYWTRTSTTTSGLEWGKWYFTPAGVIDLQAEIYNNPGNVTLPYPNPPTSFMNLEGGTLTGPYTGQYRYYRVTLATGEPAWESKVALIRVNDNCRVRQVEVVDVLDINPNPNEESTLLLSPNPVKDMLDVQLEEGEILRAATVFDFSNTLVRRETFSGTDQLHRIDLSSLEKGLYVIEIQTDKGLKRSKIIKE